MIDSNATTESPLRSPEHNQGRAESTVLSAAPMLTSKGLSILLALMCLVPIITLSVLQWAMPPVKPGSLDAEIRMVEVPPRSYYETPPEERIRFPNAALILKNIGDQSWTHLNIRINNGNYQIYEHASPIEPGQERSFLLNRFVHRSGAVFDVGINRPYSVEIYARLPDKSRGTWESELE